MSLLPSIQDAIPTSVGSLVAGAIPGKLDIAGLAESVLASKLGVPNLKIPDLSSLKSALSEPSPLGLLNTAFTLACPTNLVPNLALNFLPSPSLSVANFTSGVGNLIKDPGKILGSVVGIKGLGQGIPNIFGAIGDIGNGASQIIPAAGSLIRNAVGDIGASQIIPAAGSLIRNAVGDIGDIGAIGASQIIPAAGSLIRNAVLNVGDNVVNAASQTINGIVKSNIADIAKKAGPVGGELITGAFDRLNGGFSINDLSLSFNDKVQGFITAAKPAIQSLITEAIDNKIQDALGFPLPVASNIMAYAKKKEQLDALLDSEVNDQINVVDIHEEFGGQNGTVIGSAADTVKEKVNNLSNRQLRDIQDDPAERQKIEAEIETKVDEKIEQTITDETTALSVQKSTSTTTTEGGGVTVIVSDENRETFNKPVESSEPLYYEKKSLVLSPETIKGLTLRQFQDMLIEVVSDLKGLIGQNTGLKETDPYIEYPQGTVVISMSYKENSANYEPVAGLPHMSCEGNWRGDLQNGGLLEYIVIKNLSYSSVGRSFEQARNVLLDKHFKQEAKVFAARLWDRIGPKKDEGDW